jgi:hypothetical protein
MPGAALCAQAYLVHPRTTHLPESVWAHRRRTDQGWQWIPEGEPWADLVGFGLVKFGSAVLCLGPSWAEGTWRDLDTRVSLWTHRLGHVWHVHWPDIPHDHA